MMKNTFYFILKAVSVLQTFTFLPRLFGYVEKRFDKKLKANFKFYNVRDWATKNDNTDIAHYLKK